MRIAYITFEYPPFIIGGAGIHAIHITQELARQGHQVVIFTPDSSEPVPKKDNNTNIEIIRVPVHSKIPFRALQFWFRLPNMVKNIEKTGNFDIIHFNGISYWFLKKRVADAPHIVTIHHLVTDTITSNDETFFSRLKNISGETGFFLPIIEKRCIESADKIITVSKFTRDQVVLTYHIDPSKIDVIYNGIDNINYSFSQQELDKIKSRYEIKNKPIVLFVGRIDDPRKGLEILIEAFKLVLESIDAQLLVIGRGVQKQIRDRVDPITDKIIFTGYVDEITLKKCYNLCDVYVCPSKLEGFGLTIIEAFAAGKPVIATDVGAISELIHHGNNGSLISMNDYKSMADAIIFYLKNPSLSKEIGELNKQYILSTNSWEDSAKHISMIYGSALKKS